jgi:phosphate transport system permease protein
MIWWRRNTLSRSRTDKLLIVVLATATVIAAAILLLILMFLLRESWPVLQKIGVSPFFTDDGWHPLEGLYGLAPMLWATLAASLGAVLLATPLGLSSALFCRFFAPSYISRLYRRMVALLAGIPSVIFGFWGLTVLVPLIAKFEPPGASLMAGILILTLMILPTIALTADAALAAVPDHYLRAAAALGLSRGATIIGVALPAAKAGIMSGALLAAARALGETMAVLMVAGNVVQTPTSLFDPIRTLTANIALEMAYATGDHRASLFVSGLMLMGLVLVLAAVAGRLGGGRLHG